MARKILLGNIRGPKGDPGPQGFQGPKGDKGDTGIGIDSGFSSGPQLRQVQKKVAAQNHGPEQVHILHFGDSYTMKLWNSSIYDVAARALGGSQVGGMVSGTTSNVEINLTDNEDDFAHWPTGTTTTLHDGGHRTYGRGGASTVCDTIKAFWINNGGSFKIQIDGVDVYTPMVVADHTFGVKTFSVPRAGHTLSFVQTAGSPTIIGAGFVDSETSGVVTTSVLRGGVALNEASEQAWLNFTAFVSDIKPDLFTFEMKEYSTYGDGTTYEQRLTRLFDSLREAAPNMDVTAIGSPPIANNDADQVAQNETLKSVCERYDYIYWDSYSIFKDYPTLVAMGMQGDGTHVSEDADFYRGMLYLRDLGFLSLPGHPSPLDTFSEQIGALSRIVLGKSQLAGTPVSTIESDTVFDLDTILRLKRTLRFRTLDSDEDQFSFNIGNNEGQPSVLPRASQFGQGQAGLVGDSDTQISVRAFVNGHMLNWGTLRAIGFVPATHDETISGTYQVPVLTASVFRLTPSVDGTVISAVNGSALAEGHEISIDVIRSNTGHSYSFDDHFRFPGGVAPAIGTTTNSRDIYRFRFTWGAWACIAEPMIEVPI